MFFRSSLHEPALQREAHPSSSDPSWQSSSPSHMWLYMTHSRPSLHGLKPLRHLSEAALALSPLREACKWEKDAVSELRRHQAERSGRAHRTVLVVRTCLCVVIGIIYVFTQKPHKLCKLIVCISEQELPLLCAKWTHCCCISLVGLRGAVESAASHCISSEPSGQWARPSHTSFLRTHAVRSLHKKSSDVQEEQASKELIYQRRGCKNSC